MVSQLPGARIVSAELQSDNYDFALQFKRGERLGKSRLLNKIYLKLEKKWGYDQRLVRALRRRLFHKGVPVDQTHGNVLAQIQVVAQKTSLPQQS